MLQGLRWLAAVFFVLAGLNHFRSPQTYRQIVPPGLGAPGVLVAVSGVCEIAGGLGLLIRPIRPAAGWGLLALLVAVFPANIYMAMRPEALPDWHVPVWLLWARLPMQAVLMAWVWYVSRANGKETGTHKAPG